MALTGKRIAIPAEEESEHSELSEPMKALKEAGAQVIVEGSGSNSTYRGKRRRARVSIHATTGKVDGDDFDAIIPWRIRPGQDAPPPGGD